MVKWNLKIVFFFSRQVFAISYLFAVATAAPAAEAEAKAVADAEADPYYHAIGYQNTIPAPNCKTEHEVLTTQTCVPSTENVCETKTVETEEIEYEKVCKEVMETLCDDLHSEIKQKSLWLKKCIV